MFSHYRTSCNSLRDTSVKRSSNSHKQRRLLCILSQHCSWNQIPHLSPPPPITVISPICLGQWQASWSCSLYSFSYKSLLIVSLQGCCASPVLGLWQCADLGLSSRHVSLPGPGGRISNQELKKNPQQRAVPANHRPLIANMLKVNQCSTCFYCWNHHSLRSSQDRWLSPFQPPQQVRWHLNQVPLFWLYPLSYHWKDLSSHWLLA